MLVILVVTLRQKPDRFELKAGRFLALLRPHGGELARGQVAERAVWPAVVEVVLPSLQFRAHIVHRHELVGVQELVA